MKYFMTCFRLTLHQRLTSFRTWMVLLLLPLMALSASSMLPEWNAEASVCIGVVLPEFGGEEMWQLLQARNDNVLSFMVTDEDTLDRNIAAGRWDCGIILDEDFDQKISELDTDRIFTLRIGPGSTVYPLVKETVSSCVAQLLSSHIAQEFLSDSNITDGTLPLQLKDPDRVLINMSTLDNQPIQIPELTSRSTQNFLLWLICVSVLVKMLFSAADLSLWIHTTGVIRAQPMRTPLCSMAARQSADTVLLYLSASIALILLGESLRSTIALLGYMVFWLMFSLLLAQFPRISTVLHVSVPFAIVISFLLSSVLMDISLIFPSVSGISRWLPIRMFLQICNENWSGLLYFLIGGGLCLMSAWIVSWSKQKL